ncbi:MAG: hypothetical protein NMK33_04820 [Candidatus Cardinium sp.]|uniref:hypothetical protein n=1 Tax=Cardinium endosymbiont of Dermatophagoides farinae TaxID=2597823 RepID=UPI001183A091|nr:hypothetical protein [Cardinium endosymbiont of Dermatophagoides farinae]TSJ80751.1 hypothetical protein FPG78_01600 [Cardinium endosymbiont of Dermatophagoides farinae]UWW96750.1 MAG: hypothetical protein NMK33_04820 [Candidatus Cardinium sp.]
MKQLYKKLLKPIICLSFFYIGITPIQGSSVALTNGRLNFGAKLGYEGGFRIIESDLMSYFPVELFVAYSFKTTIEDKVPFFPFFPIFPFFSSLDQVQIGICYKSIDMNGMRKDIEPKTPFFLYPKAQEIASISFLM